MNTNTNKTELKTNYWYISSLLIIAFCAFAVSKSKAEPSAPLPMQAVQKPSLQEILRAQGITSETLSHVRLIGDEASDTSGRTKKVIVDKEFWKKHFTNNKVSNKWALSGYRTLQLYANGETHPRATLSINEAGTALVSGDPKKLRYSTKDLHTWFVKHLK